MKFVNRIFFVFGAMSMFLFVQFDAMGAKNCSSNVNAGKYCKNGIKNNCPAGCWCEGDTKYGLEDSPAITDACKNKLFSLDQLRKMHYARVYVCGIDYTSIQDQGSVAGFAGTNITYNTGQTDSDVGADSRDDCKNQFCSSSVDSGKYCNNKTVKNCPKGCYCTGETTRSVIMDEKHVGDYCSGKQKNSAGFNELVYFANRGIYRCPNGYENSSNKAKDVSDCKDKSGNSYSPSCKVGTYFNNAYKSCDKCEDGYYCPGDNKRYKCAEGTVSSLKRDKCIGAPDVDPVSGQDDRIPVVTSCESGFYYNTESSSCVECDKGYYCPGDNVKHQCASGQYTDTTGQVICKQCPTGTHSSLKRDRCIKNLDRENQTKIRDGLQTGQISNLWSSENGGNNTGGENGGNNTGGENGGNNTGGENGGNNTGGENGGNNTGGENGGNNTGGENGGNNTGGENGGNNTGGVTTCAVSGKYWYNGGCIDCESNYFCPGDGSKYKCPFGNSETTLGKSCAFNLTKSQMKGINCWTKTNAAAYRYCLYGYHLENF